MAILRIPVLVVALATCAGPSTVAPEPTPPADSQETSVKATIKRRISGLEVCYESALRSDPGLTGKMVFTLEIDASGHVENITIEEYGTGDSSMRACTEAKIRSWWFGDLGKSEEVTFSVAFTG